MSRRTSPPSGGFHSAESSPLSDKNDETPDPSSILSTMTGVDEREIEGYESPVSDFQLPTRLSPIAESLTATLSRTSSPQTLASNSVGREQKSASNALPLLRFPDASAAESSAQQTQQRQPSAPNQPAQQASSYSAYPMNGKLVWVEHPELAFTPGRVVKIINEEEILVEVDSLNDQIKMKQSDAIPVHPSCLQGVPDLLALGEFDMGPLLHNIRKRYERNEIYTCIGLPILLSVNPYKSLSRLYSSGNAAKYRNCSSASSGPAISELDPHPFAIAQHALCNLKAKNKAQSIIISGESGSGKTEATKIILSYLAGGEDGFNAAALGRELGHRASESSHKSTIENQITQANPILESFGNAKTIRNDNSSRFGKFTQVVFDEERKKLVGATISNYLLEKCRIVVQQEEERNYHIFYQLCAGRESLDPELQQFLWLQDAEDFRYLETCTTVPGRDDLDAFLEVLECLKSLDFTEDEMNAIWTILAGILHLGNVDFESKGEGSHVVSTNRLTKCCDLFAASEEAMTLLLTTTTFPDKTAAVPIRKEKNLAAALFGRDALCKTVYERLFLWLVVRINVKLSKKKEDDNKTEKSRKAEKIGVQSNDNNTIGLLDIFGFEIFESNSFEQLCINYANEQLQQHFNFHMFREEQQLYREEGIDWTHIRFEDNKQILDALTHKTTGVLPTLDSECFMPGGSDLTFQRKIVTFSGTCPVILKPPALSQTTQFGISHYAGPVFYDVYGMVEKNSDRVHDDVYITFEKEGSELLKELFTSRFSTSSGAEKRQSLPGNSRAKRNSLPSGRATARSFAQATVGCTFREQLGELMDVLGMTSASYIRCIKPNAEKAPLLFDSIDILRQLKCAGMLESIRIRKAGYGIRLAIVQFFKHYRVLLTLSEVKSFSKCVDSGSSNGVRDICKQVLRRIEETGAALENDGGPLWQVGRDKIFMKERFQAEVERLASFAWGRAVTCISRNWRRYVERSQFLKLKRTACWLQNIACMHIERARFERYLDGRRRACVRIQATWKGSAERRDFRLQKDAARKCLKAYRSSLFVTRMRGFAARFRRDEPITEEEWKAGVVKCNPSVTAQPEKKPQKSCKKESATVHVKLSPSVVEPVAPVPPPLVASKSVTATKATDEQQKATDEQQKARPQKEVKGRWSEEKPEKNTVTFNHLLAATKKSEKKIGELEGRLNAANQDSRRLSELLKQRDGELKQRDGELHTLQFKYSELDRFIKSKLQKMECQEKEFATILGLETKRYEALEQQKEEMAEEMERLMEATSVIPGLKQENDQLEAKVEVLKRELKQKKAPKRRRKSEESAISARIENAISEEEFNLLAMRNKELKEALVHQQQRANKFKQELDFKNQEGEMEIHDNKMNAISEELQDAIAVLQAGNIRASIEILARLTEWVSQEPPSDDESYPEELLAPPRENSQEMSSWDANSGTDSTTRGRPNRKRSCEYLARTDEEEEYYEYQDETVRHPFPPSDPSMRVFRRHSSHHSPRALEFRYGSKRPGGSCASESPRTEDKPCGSCVGPHHENYHRASDGEIAWIVRKEDTSRQHEYTTSMATLQEATELVQG